MFGNLGLHVMQFPSGKWGFVGSVPIELSYEPYKGSYEEALKMVNASLARFLKRKAWDSEAEARAAAEAAGHKLAN